MLLLLLYIDISTAYSFYLWFSMRAFNNFGKLDGSIMNEMK